MNKITFIDFKKNRMQKTKRWLDWLMLYMILLIGQIGIAQISYTYDWEPTGLGDWISGGGGGAFSRVTTTPCNGSGSARVNSYYNTESSLTSPALLGNNGDDLTVGFSYKVTNYSNNSTGAPISNFDEIRVEWASSSTGPWTIGYTITSAEHVVSASCISKTAIITGLPVSGNIYIRLVAKATSGADNYVYFDDVVINQGPPPTCISPSALTVIGATQISATLGWTGESSGTLFDVEIVEDSEMPVGTPTHSGVANPFLASSLSASTTYKFYVRQDCGEGDLSAWSGPFSFTTLCNAVTNLPYNEDFEAYGTGSDAFPYCWSRPVTYTSGSVWPSIVTESSSKRLRFQSAVGTPTYAVSPEFSEDINNLRLKFKLKREGTSSGTIDIGVMSDPLDLSTFELVQTIDPSNNVYNDYVFHLDTTALSGGGNHIAFRHSSIASSWYYWLDDFKVELLPSCIEPYYITASDFTADAATLSWVSDGLNFDVEWGIGEFTQSEGAVINGVSNNYELEGLSSSTTYSYYVRQNCGGDGLSIWTGPFSFTTACDLPDTATEITFTDVTATATKINYIAADPVPTGYVIFRSTSEVPPVLTSGTSYSTSQTTAVSSLTTENEDSYFCIYNGTALSGTATSLTSNTEYYYYVFSRSSENSCPGAPWYSATALTDSETTAPAAPTAAVISGLTNSTVTLSWTASVVGGGAGLISYTLEVYTDSGYTTPIIGSPFEIGTGVSQTLTGLATTTQYFYRIKANNTFGNSSYLTGNFTTTQVPATLNFVEDFEGTIDWTLNNGSATNKWHVGTASSTGTGTKSLYISKDNGVTNTYNTSGSSVVQAYRDIAVPLGTNMGTISFDWKGMGEGTTTAYDYFRVWLVPATFMPSSGSQISSGTGRVRVGDNFNQQETWQYYENTELNLSSFAGNIMRVVFEWKTDTSGGSGNAAAIDNVEITVPACAAPTDLTVISYTANSADLGWSSLGEDFDIKWGEFEFDFDTEGALVPDFANGETLLGLIAGTKYEYYVRQNCGVVDGVSTWSGPFSFTTLCEPIVDLPYTENFDTYGTGSNAFPDCWIRPVTFTSGGVVWPSLVTYESGNRLRFQSEVGIPTYAVSPAFTEDISNIRVRFKLKREGPNSGTLDIGVMSNPLDINTFELIQTISPDNSNFNDYVFYLDTTELSGSNKQIAFRQNSNLNNWYYWLDDLVIDKIPTCFPPLNIQVSNVDKNSADVAWEVPDMGNTPEDGYVIEVRTEGNPGDTVGFVSTVNAADLVTIITGLEVSTNYTLYIKSLCTEEDDESIWSEGVSFTTLCNYADIEVVNAADLTICGSGSINIEVESEGVIKWYASEDATNAVFTGDIYATEVLTDTTSFWVESVRGTAGVTVQVGTGNETTNTDGSPFYHSYGGYKYQYIFTKEELIASGLFEGPITALAFDVTQSATVNYSNFTIAIGTTTQNVATNTHVDGLTQVYSNASLATPVGIHFYQFDSAFEWDGLSNVVVQVNWSNNNSGSYAASALVKSHTVSTSRTTMTRVDNRTAAEILATMNGVVTGGNGGTSAISRRPNTYFIGNAACVSPREEVIVTVAPTSEIEDVTITHTTGDTARVNIDSEGTSFAIEYGETGFEHGEGVLIEDATHVHTLSNLTDEGEYDVYVRNTCGAWFGPVTFTSINIAMPQTITAEDVVKAYGDEPFTNGSSDSGLALNYVVTDSTVLNVVDGELVIVGGGATTVIASQGGTENFLEAEEVTFNVTVNKVPLTVRVEDEEKVYDGLAYTSGTLLYEGFVYQDTATDLSGDAVFGGTGFGAIDVGVYEVEVSGLISDSYVFSYEPGALEIVKATLQGIEFEDQVLIYDGTEKSILISGNIPSGVIVSYENNAKIEAGDYVVNALIDGGLNYNDLELEAMMKIRKSLASVVFDNSTLAYNGSAQSIFVSDNVPAGVTVTYSNNAKTNVGVYEVVATLDGGDIYENVILIATMTIEQAVVEDVVLLDADYVYDGQERQLVLTGTLPDGVTVSYTNNTHTNAGIYQVSAVIDGGVNYESETLDAVLTIEQASLANVLSLDDVSYTYDGGLKTLLVTGVIPEGVQVSYENNAHSTVGNYEVVAIVDGGDNYESVRYTATLTITRASLANTIQMNDMTYEYDGSTKVLLVTGQIPVEVLVTYENNQQTNVGVYGVIATVSGGDNYEDLNLSATLTITTGIIRNVLFESATFNYDGLNKTLLLNGTLPAGTSVTYYNNHHTEIGVYEARAEINGGANYHDVVLTATLTIQQGDVPNIRFPQGSFTYDGTEKSIFIQGDLPVGTSVTYVNNGQTESGTYQVTALINGAGLYNNMELRANLIIRKAPIEGLVFNGGNFVYDGTEKNLSIGGVLPEGVTVSYLNNGKINAGSYTVYADINAGANYVSTTLSAIMVIQKAPQEIHFEVLTPVVLGEDSDFQLTATTVTGLPIHYTYTYSGMTAAATVSATGWVSIQEVGEIVITASQAGDNNYLAAASVDQVLVVVSKNASIRELWVEDVEYSDDLNNISYVMDCSNLKSEVHIRIVSDDDALVSPAPEFVIHTYKPGIYKQVVTVTSQDGSVHTDYTIQVEKPFSFEEIGVQKFDNTLLINNNPKTNGGYSFVGYQWFKNGELVGEDQVYSAGSTDYLDKTAIYHAVVTTSEGVTITVCPMELVQSRALRVQMYPSPVMTGGVTTLSIEGSRIELQGVPIHIYNVKGQLVHRAVVTGVSTDIQLPLTMQSGVYMATIELGGEKQTIKFIVE